MKRIGFFGMIAAAAATMLVPFRSSAKNDTDFASLEYERDIADGFSSWVPDGSDLSFSREHRFLGAMIGGELYGGFAI